MKPIRFLPTLCLTAIAISAYAVKPKTDTTNRWMRITDVERTDSSLRVGVRLQNPPHFWVKVSPSTRLMQPEDTTIQYKLIGTENIEPGKKIRMPESGQHEGVLIFEKVPSDIRIVDMVESDPADAGNCTYGIALDQQENPVRPDIISLTDILQSSESTDGQWNGLDPKRYSDISFYDKEGCAHIRGRINDYSPRCGVKTFSVRTKDDFTAEEKINVGDINPDGTFELDIPLSYPQFDYLIIGDTHKEIFLMPGNTLNISTCMAQRIDPDKGFVPEYFGYEGKADDAVAVNMLSDSLLSKRYSLHSLYSRYKVENTDSMKTETYKRSERLAELLDSVITDIPGLIGDLPVSGFAKDMLSIYAIGSICGALEDIQLDFTLAKGPRNEIVDGTLSFKEGERLDDKIFVRPWLRHKDLIYNNPLLICNGWILPNRWTFNTQFHPTAMAAEGKAPAGETTAYVPSDNPTYLYETDLNRLDSIGLGNCFVAQLVRTMSLIDNMHTTDEPSAATLKRNNLLVANAIRHNEYDALNEILLTEHNGFVKDVLIFENQLDGDDSSSRVIPDTPEGDILSRIIEPYKGNVLFLDFWGIGCGPCRAAMIKQKSILKNMADQPFKTLYIANADDGMEACRKWLSKEDIKGEHIFVSRDDWQRLSGLLNFSAIPFGVLIDKEGNIIKTHYSIHEDDTPLRKALKQ